ncbi:MAG: 3-phosphoglycerate dehydrogenase [Oligoflexia bacterium]|nr:3-phosphoglycerate dehydrogenase [Oligoflexia bacterium]
MRARAARIHTGPLTRGLVVENPHPDLDRLLSAQGMEITRLPDVPQPDELVDALQRTRAHVLFKRSRLPVSRGLIQACPDLLAVYLCCIGDDSVDKQACADHGVMVFNDPISNGRSVVEMAIGHLITLSRRFYDTDRQCRAGVWDKNNWERYEIRGKVLGVLGLGNIGRALARTAQALGMEIRFHDTRQVAIELGQELGFGYAPTIADLFAGSDYVSVHLSATDISRQSNQGLLDDGVLLQLGAERPDSSPRIYLNLSRGFLHQPQALINAVQSGRIRRAAVDVYPDEPRSKDDLWVSPYSEVPEIVVTPHIGASTLEAQPRIARRVSETITDFSQAGMVRDCVFTPRTSLSVVDGGRAGGAVLVVAHATTRGTKRAIDEIIFNAGASNLSSEHRDFDHLGMALDLALLDRPLSDAQLRELVEHAHKVTEAPSAIRSIRQVQRS